MMAAERPDLETLLSEFVGLTGIDRSNVSALVPIKHSSESQQNT